MTNGADHNQGNSDTPQQPKVEAKPATKPAAPAKPPSGAAGGKPSK